MNQFDQSFARQAEEMMQAAQNARVPESMQAFAEESVAKSRDAYRKLAAAAVDGSKALEQVANTAQANATALTEKAIQNFAANTEAAFNAAEAMARSRTFPEAAKVQVEFMQSQFAKASEQTREFYELSARMTRDTFETMNAAASRTFESLRGRS